MLPPFCVLDAYLLRWLEEDIGWGDLTTGRLFPDHGAPVAKAQWLLKAPGVVSGMEVAQRIFSLVNPLTRFTPIVGEGIWLPAGTIIATIEGPMGALLIAERVSLNLVMRLSGISTLAYVYAQTIEDLPTQVIDTRKTTPGLRLFEKYAVTIGGGGNHRARLDDAVMIKDNHIHGAGSLTAAVKKVRQSLPITTKVEVETETIEQVKEALEVGVDIVMLDNMDRATMAEAVALARSHSPCPLIEASGNITLDNLRSVAELGVDFISTSAMVTRSSWLDISMRMVD